MKRLLSAIGLTVIALTLSACGGNGNTTPNQPPCGSPAGTTVALVYPAPGSTGITTNPGQVIIGSTTALPASWNVVLAASPGNIAGGTVATTTPPFPTPNQTPSFPNPQYQSSSIASGALQGNVLYTAFINDTSSNCTPSVSVGSFHT
ncbi:MAG: hypothetical protein M3Y21_11460 [Candidatus Eremiobacteraeota bacterium]|nr:hypothetical protein [Candidatus Eremiobacteraeota bacterium]